MEKISILIPVFNEKNTLLELLRRVEEVDFEMEKEIILIDDCSNDGTQELYKDIQYKILYHDIVEGVIPQTLPVVLIGTDRYKVYLEMNKLGWGVVSLYHTMIPQLKNIEYQEECWLSEHITNLPVHQDVEEKLIGEMINNFINVVNKHAN